MIDDSTEETLADGRSLKFLKDAELQAPDIVDRICGWWQWKEVVK